jgi:hypothetical protein
MDRNVVRRRQRLFRYSVDLFVEMVNKITKRKMNYKCNDADIKSFENFIGHYGINVGEEYIRKFLEYQMQSWFNDGTDVDYSRKLRFNWCFGEKAIKRWEKFDIAFSVKITREDIKQRLDINTVKNKTEINKMVLQLIESEENHKAKYLNTKRGLLWCIANTTLYFHKSPKCAICEHKDDCKQTLKENYNKIYKLRGYGETAC